MKTWQWAAVLALAATAHKGAGGTEPNETFAARTILASGVLSLTDELTPGGVAAPDTFLGVKDHFGEVYATDDDGSPLGNGFASGLGGVPTNSGSIDFCITGYGDDFFVGSHGESGAYEVFVDVYDFFDDLVDSFSEVRTLEPGAVHDFSFSDFEWINGSYNVYIDNLVPGPADVDFFTFTGLTPGAAFTAQTFDPALTNIDTVLGWFDAAGTFITDDDDGAGGVLSKLDGTVPSEGALTFAVTGYGDQGEAGYVGSHEENGSYELRLTFGGGLAADFNNDDTVDGDDLTDWRNSFGDDALANADGDSDSDGADFLIWQRELGLGASSPTSAALSSVVPEPAGLAVVFTAAIGAAVFRRSSRPFLRKAVRDFPPLR